jgi:glycosyl transferase family 87
MRLSATLVFAAILGSALLWFGIAPAWTTVATDFPNYYTSARLVVEGRDVSRVYEADWFQSQIYREGIDQQGIFAPLPPVTALLMVPIAFLSPLPALRAWTIVNMILLAANIVLLSRCTGRGWPFCMLLFLSSGIALLNNFRFGQCYLLITLLIMAGYLGEQSSRPGRSGIAFGTAAALKYFPVAFIPLFMIRREWKLILAFVSTVAALTLLAALPLGVEVYRRFLTVLPGHLEGEILNPFGATLQSWNSLLRRMFVPDPLLNPSPVLDWQSGYYLVKYTIYLLVLILTIRSYRDASKALGPKAPPFQFALVSVAGLLLLPASATYHFLLLVLPVALLLRTETGRWRPEQKVLLLLFLTISWIPYRLFRPFDGRGLLSILAYPRLGLLVAMFLTLRLFLRNSGEPGEPSIIHD